VLSSTGVRWPSSYSCTQKKQRVWALPKSLNPRKLEAIYSAQINSSARGWPGPWIEGPEIKTRGALIGKFHCI